MKKQIQQGFTLIELMIVVAIIGILASIALPAYQTYVAKTDITSTMASAAAGKTAVWTRYVDLGKMPAAGTGAGGIAEAKSATEGLNSVMTNLDYASAVSYVRTSDTEAAFEVTLDKVNGNVNGKKMTYTFEDADGELKFICEADTTIDNKYLPKECHNVTP